MAANNDPFNWIMIKQIDDSNISSSSFPIAANVCICQVFFGIVIVDYLLFQFLFTEIKFQLSIKVIVLKLLRLIME